ncbi:hypothetical protein ACFYYS_17010 [Streptomyces sp. NPDC002120]|uniref:hypothetical protein n=1 Tax=Streptomyces sp. NPDC002120 TaxID=3364631 RepID=UPI0036849D41
MAEEREHPSPRPADGMFRKAIWNSGTTTGGDEMGESEIAALEADMKGLKGELADLSALLLEVQAELLRLARRCALPSAE